MKNILYVYIAHNRCGLALFFCPPLQGAGLLYGIIGTGFQLLLPNHNAGSMAARVRRAWKRMVSRYCFCFRLQPRTVLPRVAKGTGSMRYSLIPRAIALSSMVSVQLLFTVFFTYRCVGMFVTSEGGDTDNYGRQRRNSLMPFMIISTAMAVRIIPINRSMAMMPRLPR